MTGRSNSFSPFFHPRTFRMIYILLQHHLFFLSCLPNCSISHYWYIIALNDWLNLTCSSPIRETEVDWLVWTIQSPKRPIFINLMTYQLERRIGNSSSGLPWMNIFCYDGCIVVAPVIFAGARVVCNATSKTGEMHYPLAFISLMMLIV